MELTTSLLKNIDVIFAYLWILFKRAFSGYRSSNLPRKLSEKEEISHLELKTERELEKLVNFQLMFKYLTIHHYLFVIIYLNKAISFSVN